MGKLSRARTYGGIGSLLVLLSALPFVGALFGTVGFILILMAIKDISRAVNDKSVFNSALISIVLAIIGLMLATFVVTGSLLQFVGLNNAVLLQTFGFYIGSSVAAGDWVGLVVSNLGGIFVFWIVLLMSATYARRVYNSISARLHETKFRTAGLVYVTGSAITIVLVGFVLLLVAQILLAVAFFSMDEELPKLPTPQISPIMPPSSST